MRMPIKELLTTTEFFSDPMAVLGRDGTIETLNQSFADSLGVPLEALAGRRLDGLAAASALAIQEYVRACAESAKVVRGSFVLRRRAETVAVQARGIAY